MRPQDPLQAHSFSPHSSQREARTDGKSASKREEAAPRELLVLAEKVLLYVLLHRGCVDEAFEP